MGKGEKEQAMEEAHMNLMLQLRLGLSHVCPPLTKVRLMSESNVNGLNTLSCESHSHLFRKV